MKDKGAGVVADGSEPVGTSADEAYHGGYLKGFNDGWDERGRQEAEARARIAEAQARLDAPLLSVLAKYAQEQVPAWAQEFRGSLARLRRERIDRPQRAPGPQGQRIVALILCRGRDGEIVRCWPIDGATLIRRRDRWEQWVDRECTGWWPVGDVLMPGRVDQHIAPGMDVGVVASVREQ